MGNKEYRKVTIYINISIFYESIQLLSKTISSYQTYVYFIEVIEQITETLKLCFAYKYTLDYVIDYHWTVLSSRSDVLNSNRFKFLKLNISDKSFQLS